MGVGRELPPIPTVFAGANKRRAGRVRLALVRSTLGDVLDLSATGARIRSPRAPRCAAGDELRLTIAGLEGPIATRALVAWVRRAGLRRPRLSPAARENAAGFPQRSLPPPTASGPHLDVRSGELRALTGGGCFQGQPLTPLPGGRRTRMSPVTSARCPPDRSGPGRHATGVCESRPDASLRRRSARPLHSAARRGPGRFAQIDGPAAPF